MANEIDLCCEPCREIFEKTGEVAVLSIDKKTGIVTGAGPFVCGICDAAAECSRTDEECWRK